jgi:hypothetical protein
MPITVAVITHEHTIGHHGNYRSGSANSDRPPSSGHPANLHGHGPAEPKHAKTLLLAKPNVTMPSHPPSAVSCAVVTACVGPNYRRNSHLTAPSAVLAPLSCMFWLMADDSKWITTNAGRWARVGDIAISKSHQSLISWSLQTLDHLEVKGHLLNLPSSPTTHHHRLVSYHDDPK